MKRYLLRIIVCFLAFCLVAGIEKRVRDVLHHSCYALALPIIKTAATILPKEVTSIRRIVYLIRLVIK